MRVADVWADNWMPRFLLHDIEGLGPGEEATDRLFWRDAAEIRGWS